MEELTHWKRPWCFWRHSRETLKAAGEGDDRGWDGWLASPTQWTRVWANSGSWWWQWSLVCCSPCGCKASSVTEWLKWSERETEKLSQGRKLPKKSYRKTFQNWMPCVSRLNGLLRPQHTWGQLQEWSVWFGAVLGSRVNVGKKKKNKASTPRKMVNHLMHLIILKVLWYWAES